MLYEKILKSEYTHRQMTLYYSDTFRRCLPHSKLKSTCIKTCRMWVLQLEKHPGYNIGTLCYKIMHHWYTMIHRMISLEKHIRCKLSVKIYSEMLDSAQK